MTVQHSGSGSTAALLARRAAAVAPGVPMATGIAVERAHGAVLIDPEGREFLDLAAGIGVMNIGHSDPAILAAIVEQAARLQHVCMHITTYEPYVAVCEELVRLFPHGGPTRALLLNSGAEAVENAVKIARQTTGRSAVICFTGAFHGRTLLGMSLTSKVAYKTGCGPFAPEIYRLPYPNPLRGGEPDPAAFVARELGRLREAFKTHVAAANVAAILIEPVLGEGGFVPAPREYLVGLREICDEHGIVLIFDEVQSGFGRTGAWGAYQALGVVPDLSTWAKALGGGLPLSAVVGKASVLDRTIPGTLGGTFGGNPIACAAALATIRRIEEQDLCGRARALGEQIRARLTALSARFPEIVDVRGVGAMMAMEFCTGGDLDRPDGALVGTIVRGCQRDGVLVISAGVHGAVIRLLPPLVMSDEQLDRALTVIEKNVQEALS
jgi:4-aminobutyrate aminotransferase/(S)-3-amino-2-methylpropionate transaminase